MTTTLLFIELLIIGWQVTIWLLLLFELVLNIQLYNYLPSIISSDWTLTLVIILTAISYGLGIIFDRFADRVFSSSEKRIRRKLTPNYPLFTTQMKAELGEYYHYYENQFEYAKSRLRIARASSINFAAYTILVIALIYTRYPANSEYIREMLMLFSFFVGFGITVGAIISWRKITETYLGLVKTAYETINSLTKYINIQNIFELRNLLTSHDINISKWGKGNSKTIQDLWREIERGDSKIYGYPLNRVVEVVKMKIYRENDGYILIEKKQEMQDGRFRSRNILPSEKKLSGETVIDATKRGIQEELKEDFRKMKFIDKNPLSYSETKDGVSFPGLSTLYQYKIVRLKIKGLPTNDFQTEENSDDPVKKHFWAWENEEEWKDPI